MARRRPERALASARRRRDAALPHGRCEEEELPRTMGRREKLGLGCGSVMSLGGMDSVATWLWVMTRLMLSAVAYTVVDPTWAPPM